ncbi:MAG: RNA polymerase sigma factor [Chromatiales bacterium]|nr:RNA polymerase sigma factor [Chromatiales bacterium]
MADFAQLVTEQIPRLRRYARALVGTQRADDLVQDCLERAWSRRRLWDGQGELRAWLFTILHNPTPTRCANRPARRRSSHCRRRNWRRWPPPGTRRRWTCGICSGHWNI